jgi:hypothetical protein
MSSLNWSYTLRIVGEQGGLSGPVVVRTVVSIQSAQNVGSDPPPFHPLYAVSARNLTTP